MQIYWSLKSIPELAGLASAERRRAWRAACWNAYRHWQVWASVAGIGTVIGAAFGGLIHGQVLTEFARPYLRTFSAPQLR